jgi:hypothetical protein
MASFLDSLIPSAGVNIAPSMYTGGAQANQDLMSGISGLSQYNLGGQNLGQYSNLAQQGVNNPYAGQYQGAANTLGPMLQGAGMGTFGAGGMLQGANLGMLPDVQALTAMGFDPQQALYNRTAQQVRDQSAAQAASSGVGGTPYGQGVANQANQNFNIDWQNQQLARGLAGAQGAGSLLGNIGSGVGQGAQLQNMGGQQYMQGGALPYSTFGGINQGQRDILNQAGAYGIQAAAIPQMQNQDWANYLQNAMQSQLGTQSQNLTKSQQEFNQGQQLFGDLGKMAAFGLTGGMSSFMPGLSFGGGGGFPGMSGQFGGQGFGGGWNPFSGGGFFGQGGNWSGYKPSS